MNKLIVTVDIPAMFGWGPPSEYYEKYEGPRSSDMAEDFSVYLHGALEAACGYDIVSWAAGHIHLARYQPVTVVDTDGAEYEAVMVMNSGAGFYAGLHAYIVDPTEVDMAERDLVEAYGGELVETVLASKLELELA